jgi:hypothetical protein
MNLLVLALMVSAQAYRSHPPDRPLPAASARPLPSERMLFVDAARGDDANDGTESTPWKTIRHAAGRAQAGDTVVLRGGTYYENVEWSASGTPGRPVTLRGHPREVAVIDGGWREFFETPAEAWEPVEGGAPGEYRSRREYPGVERVVGNFGDSWVPLYPYSRLIDVRSENEYWNIGGKLSDEKGVYCGPGMAIDPQTRRIHLRLAHTKMEVPAVLRETYRPYRGETDPRKLPLVVAGSSRPALRLSAARHVRVFDLAVRGAARATLGIEGCEDVEFDHVSVYGGQPALAVSGTVRFRLTHSALRGLCAPWAFRTIKYRGPAPYLIVARGGDRQNEDFEVAHCEFTDSHDFLLPSVKRFRFHHNLVDNHNDDGIYLSAEPPNVGFEITQNRIARCLTTFAFYGKHPTGGGVYIARNVFDFRPPVHYHHPAEPGKQGGEDQARMGGDHGGPTWEPMFAYHNTVLLDKAGGWRTAAETWGGHTKGTVRRVFNNLFVQSEGRPALPFPSADDDFQADGNLHWSLSEGSRYTGDFFAKYRASPLLAASRKNYPPGWAAQDLFADPRFEAFGADWAKPSDLRLRADSPAIDAGVGLPAEWPDPLRAKDKGRPDLGAIPAGADPDRIGVDGRHSLSPTP